MRRGSGGSAFAENYRFGRFDTKFRSVYSIASCICFCKSAHRPRNLERFCYWWVNHTPAYRQSDKINHSGSQPQPLRPPPIPSPINAYPPFALSRSVFGDGGPACPVGPAVPVCPGGPVGPVVTAPVAHAMFGDARLHIQLLRLAAG